MIIQTQTLRPTKIKGWIALAILLLYTCSIFSRDQAPSTENIMVLIAGMLLTAGLFLIQQSMIVLDNDGITHKQFRRQKFIAFRDIRSADLVTHYHGHGYTVMWEIRTLDGQMYSMLPYGKKNMRSMAETLSIKLDRSAMGERVIKLAEGKRVIFF